MKSNNKGFGIIGWLVVLALLSAGGYYGYKSWQNSRGPKYDFDTATAKTGPLTQSVVATGTINPVINVQVGSQVSGNIQKLFADWNSKVTAGQIVAQIDPSLFQAAVTQAEGNLKNSKAALALATIQLKRTQDLRATDSTPQSTLDQAQATVDQATAQVETNQGALDLAEANLKNCSIASPVNGVVITRNVDVGQTVAAGLNAPVIFVIANDLAKMQIDTSVSEADIGNVVEGEDVDFTVYAFPETFHGKVIQVRNSPTTVQNVVTYDAVIGVSNPDLKLKPGMTATTTIIIKHKDDAVQIPNSAFRVHMPEELLPKDSPAPQGGASPEKGGNAAPGKNKDDPSLRLWRTIYVLHDGDKIPKPLKVKIGITDGAFTEVAEGLKAGDKVVTSVISSQSGGAQQTNLFGPPRRY